MLKETRTGIGGIEALLKKMVTAAVAVAAQAPSAGVIGALLKMMKITMVLQEAVNQLESSLMVYICWFYMNISVTIFLLSSATFSIFCFLAQNFNSLLR